MISVIHYNLKELFKFDFLQYGKTKLFFNKSAMDRLDRLTRDSQRKVTTAQSGKNYPLRKNAYAFHRDFLQLTNFEISVQKNVIFFFIFLLKPLIVYTPYNCPAEHCEKNVH